MEQLLLVQEEQKYVTSWVWILVAIVVVTLAVVLSLYNGWNCVHHHIHWWNINLWFYQTAVKCY